MMNLLAVGLGGFLGSIARYWLSGVVYRYSGGGFPYGTLAVNVLGCLLIGGVMGLVEYRQLFGPGVRTFLTFGILGGFTTFSTFGFETFALLRDHQHWLAVANVASNVVVGTLAVMIGWFLAKFLGG